MLVLKTPHPRQSGVLLTLPQSQGRLLALFLHNWEGPPIGPPGDTGPCSWWLGPPVSKKNLLATVNASCSPGTKLSASRRKCPASLPAPLPAWSPPDPSGDLQAGSLAAPVQWQSVSQPCLRPNAGSEATLPTHWWHSSFVSHVPYHHLCTFMF